MLAVSRNKRRFLAIIIGLFLFVAVGHLWLRPVVGNYLGRNAVRCRDCAAVSSYLVRTGQTTIPPHHTDIIVSDYRRDKLVLEGTADEIILTLNELNVGLCERCIYWLAQIFALPIGSDEWRVAHHMFSSPRSRTPTTGHLNLTP